MKKLLDFINVPLKKNEGSFQDYLNMIDNGLLDDHFCYGISDHDENYCLVDPVKQPGALYCGGMGSGKSVAMKFTTISHYLANAHKTLYILIDPLKGMLDYLPLFKYKENVTLALNDISKVIAAIEMVSAEMHARKTEFSKIGANNIYAYDSIMKKRNENAKPLARIVICIEEFHAIPYSDQIQYNLKADKPGTSAFMLKEILRVGRSYGITIMVATQRATADDFPSSLKPGITQMMVFRVNNPTDATAVNLAHAMDISSSTRGRCAYEHGFIQFPFLDDPTSTKLLDKYAKPFNAELFKYQVDDYHKAFEGDGNEGMVLIKPFKSLIENWNSFNPDAIITRLLKYFEFNVEPQRNPALNINLIAEKKGKTFAVHIMKKQSGMVSPKTMSTITEHALAVNCQNLIIIYLDSGNVPQAITSHMNTNPMNILLDYEDLIRISGILDNKNSLEQEGKFDTLFNNIVLHKNFLQVESKLEKKETKEPLATKSQPEQYSNFFETFEQMFPSKEAKKDTSLENKENAKNPSIIDDEKKK